MRISNSSEETYAFDGDNDDRTAGRRSPGTTTNMEEREVSS